jgi:RNA-directed DNA polymerase
MTRLAQLQAATSLSDVAELLGFKPKALSYILFKQPLAAKYKTFEIPKRNGGHRQIHAPVDALKLLQRRLSVLLQDCSDEITATANRKDRAAHGFKRKRSIITNARQHRHRRWVFNLDLEDFFPSIHFGRIRGFLLKNRDFKLSTDASTVIAQIACHGNALPQGSPCSPAISNLVAHLLDIRLVRLASDAGCTYSRYADDLTFSTNKKLFPAAIATPAGANGAPAHSWLPGEPLRKVIERTGFRINPKKTHLMYRTSRQDVTGLVINQKISVRSEYRHNVRAMVNSLVRTGAFEILGLTQANGQTLLQKRPGTLNELHGMLGFIDTIDVYNRTNTLDAPSGGLSSRERVYRAFLFYSLFYAGPAPVVLFEGDTDRVYLTHAIRSLAADYPTLAQITPDKKIRLTVRLYRYSKSSTSRLLGLKDGQGTGVLGTFIGAYKKETSHFTAPVPMHPVIILYDNDSGARSIHGAIKGVSAIKPTGAEPFIHVFKNLYAIHTPGGPPSKIEDLFSAATKATVIDGKTFNDGPDFDPDKHYSKKVFAHRVIEPKADIVDFTGFKPLLATLVTVINEYHASVTPPVPGP